MMACQEPDSHPDRMVFRKSDQFSPGPGGSVRTVVGGVVAGGVVAGGDVGGGLVTGAAGATARGAVVVDRRRASSWRSWAAAGPVPVPE